jgi:hypothetical protein
VDATFHDDSPTANENALGCSDLPSSPCVEATIHSTFRGSWTSDDSPVEAQARPGRDPGTTRISGTQTFNGAVAGCGEGTFTMSFAGTDDYGHMTEGPSGLGTTERYDWTLVQGSGTGGLAGLRSGSGTATGVRYIDGSGDGALAGSLFCAR